MSVLRPPKRTLEHVAAPAAVDLRRRRLAGRVCAPRRADADADGAQPGQFGEPSARTRSQQDERKNRMAALAVGHARPSALLPRATTGRRPGCRAIDCRGAPLPRAEPKGNGAAPSAHRTDVSRTHARLHPGGD